MACGGGGRPAAYTSDGMPEVHEVPRARSRRPPVVTRACVTCQMQLSQAPGAAVTGSHAAIEHGPGLERDQHWAHSVFRVKQVFRAKQWQTPEAQKESTREYGRDIELCRGLQG